MFSRPFRLIALAGLFWAGLCPIVALSAPPELTVPETKQVDSGKPIVLKGDTKAKWVKYVPIPNSDGKVLVESDFGSAFDVPLSPKAIILEGEDGSYKVLAFTANDDGATVKWVQITVGKPKPQPKPGPQPGPQPPGPIPQPTGQVKAFVVVEDTTKAGQFRGDILGSAKVQAYYKQAGLTHLLLSTQAKGPEGGDLPDAEKKWLGKANGKQLPYLCVVYADGTEVEQDCPTDPDKFIAAIGGAPHQRAMGNNPPNERRLKLVRFGDAANVPLIPRAQWREINLGNYLPPVHDQDGRGQCNPSATCTAAEFARYLAGMSYVYLSAGDLYSQINGGHDDGSLLEDGLATMMKSGVATATSVPYIWDGRTHNTAAVLAERKNYVVVEAYECPDFDSIASALQQGFVIIEGILWYDNYNPDRDGWLPIAQQGRPGGHALCGFGLAKRGNTWGIWTRNSWGTSWGLGGNCVIPESAFGKGIGGFWAIRSMVRTPTTFPAPKVSKGLDPFRKDIERVHERQAAPLPRL